MAASSGFSSGSSYSSYTSSSYSSGYSSSFSSGSSDYSTGLSGKEEGGRKRASASAATARLKKVMRKEIIPVSGSDLSDGDFAKEKKQGDRKRRRVSPKGKEQATMYSDPEEALRHGRAASRDAMPEGHKPKKSKQKASGGHKRKYEWHKRGRSSKDRTDFYMKEERTRELQFLERRRAAKEKGEELGNLPKVGRVSTFQYPKGKLPPSKERLCFNGKCKRPYYKSMKGWRVGPEGAGTLCQNCHNKWLRGILDYVPWFYDGQMKELVDVRVYRKRYAGRLDGPSFPGDPGHKGAVLPGGKQNAPNVEVEETPWAHQGLPWDRNLPAWAGPPDTWPADGIRIPLTAEEDKELAAMHRPGYRPETTILHTRKVRRHVFSRPRFTFHGCLYTADGFQALLNPARPRLDVDRLWRVRHRSTQGVLTGQQPRAHKDKGEMNGLLIMLPRAFKKVTMRRLVRMALKGLPGTKEAPGVLPAAAPAE